MNSDPYSARGVSVNKIETVFDLLSLVERCPREYLGGVEGSDSYAALVGYLNGLEYSNFFNAKEHSLREFKEWAHKEHACKSADDFYRWLDEEYGADRAFTEFFEVLKKYKAEKEILS
ncbi:MAG: hypothetical protein AAFV47_07410 [Pseudomonadota bacterium]